MMISDSGLLFWATMYILNSHFTNQIAVACKMFSTTTKQPHL